MENYYVRLTKDMGRGMFANRDLKVGEVVTYCELLVLDEKDTAIANKETNLADYTFTFNDKQDCIVLGDGSIFNHSDIPNVKYELKTITDSFGSRTLMCFTVIRPILEDEQMFIDYGADVNGELTSAYTINLVG